MELRDKRQRHESQLDQLNKWLIDHYSHPDRIKVLRDRSFHQAEINIIDAKLKNL